MKNIYQSLYLFIIFLFFSTQGAFSQPGSSDVYPGVVRVRFKPAAYTQMQPQVQVKTVDTRNGKPVMAGLKSFDALNTKYHATRMSQVFPYDPANDTKHEKYGFHLWYEVTIADSEDPVEVARKYQLDENVEIAEPVYRIRQIDGGAGAGMVPYAVSSNDEYYIRQWHYHNTGQASGIVGVDIRLPEAWEQTMGNPKVIVAVVDGGIDYSHEDLGGNMWTDENGDHGKSFAAGASGITPTTHGTHVAGTIAALSNNSKGVAGIAGGNGGQGGVRLMSCQVFLEGDAVPSNTPAAIRYAADNGAVILQNSWGYLREGAYNTPDLQAIDYFIENAGKDKNGNPLPGTPMVGGIVIFAAGNDNSTGKWYPGYYSKVLSVAAITNRGAKAYYSNYGDWVDIAAPGGDISTSSARGIWSTLPGNKYGTLQGTSMACPHVSGVAALILSKFGNENYTPDMLWARLVNTTTSLEEWDPYYYKGLGAGLVNAEKALQPDDGIPPAAIGDLQASNPLSTSALLSWTAPADADNLNAYSYKIAVSKSPLTAANFNDADTIIFIKAKAAGTKEEQKVGGLHPATTYYAAILSADIWGNQSGISNVISFAPVNHPPQSKGMAAMTIRDVGPDKTIDLNAIFSDVDGDQLEYTVSVSNSLAQASATNGAMTIHPMAAGATNLQIIASDPFGLTVSDGFELTITQNHAPVLSSTATSLVMQPHQSTELNLSDYFSDPEGDAIGFTLHTSSALVDAEITGSSLEITAIGSGSATLGITGQDTYGAQSGTFTVDIRIDPYMPGEPGKLLIYPVPVISVLNYAFVLASESDVEIRAISSDGRLVFKTAKIRYTTGGHEATIDMAGWPKGVYVIQLLVNDKLQDAKKAVK